MFDALNREPARIRALAGSNPVSCVGCLLFLASLLCLLVIIVLTQRLEDAMAQKGAY